MLKFSTNQSGHVTILSLSDWLNLSLTSIEAEKTFIGSGPDFYVAASFNPCPSFKDWPLKLSSRFE